MKRKPPAPRLLVEERRRLIVEHVERKGRATVDELATRFGISAVTSRSDLEALAGNAAIVRAHGGAVPAPAYALDTPLRIKQTLSTPQKRRIGQAAATFVEDGETIILDSGSTTLEIARVLRQRRWRELTVITNSLHIALELGAIASIRVMMLGGLLRTSSHSLVGSGAENMLAQLSADRLFLGVDGLDATIGVTTPDPQEATLNARMIHASRQTIAVFDASKFGQRSLSVIAPLSALDLAITDSLASADCISALETAGVRVVRA